MRNSVKAVVDAYDGTVTYYADLNEPIVQAWSRAFPGVFKPIEQAPDELWAISATRRTCSRRRRSTSPTTSRTRPRSTGSRTSGRSGDRPTSAAGVATDGTTSAAEGTRKLLPNYLLMRLPDEEEEHFHLVTRSQPEDRLNMVGWMAANSDPDGYGELVAFTFPSGRDVDGPRLAYSDQLGPGVLGRSDAPRAGGPGDPVRRPPHDPGGGLDH